MFIKKTRKRNALPSVIFLKFCRTFSMRTHAGAPDISCPGQREISFFYNVYLTNFKLTSYSLKSKYFSVTL